MFPTKIKGDLGGFVCSFAFVSTLIPHSRSAITHQSQFMLCGYVPGRRDKERYFNVCLLCFHIYWTKEPLEERTSDVKV